MKKNFIPIVGIGIFVMFNIAFLLPLILDSYQKRLIFHPEYAIQSTIGFWVVVLGWAGVVFAFAWYIADNLVDSIEKVRSKK